MGALFLSQAVIDGVIPAMSYTGPGPLPQQTATAVQITDGLSIDSVAVANPAGQATSTLVIPWVQVVADSDYLELGVKKGFNCMYFTSEIDAAGRPITLDAKMVFAHEREYRPCDDKALMVQQGFPLNVTVNGTGRVPTATRWDWSETDQLHMIGAPCPIASTANTAPVSGLPPGRLPHGIAPTTTPLRAPWVPTKWCDVGAATSIGSAPHGTTPYQKAVKGWSDEQYLADPSAGSLARTDIMGTVFPEADLNTRTRDFYTNTFKTVSYVALRVVAPGPTATAALATYRQRFGFETVAPSSEFSKMGTIALCWGPASKCLEGVPDHERPKCIGLSISSRWWARTQNAPDAAERLTRYHCVKYRGPHAKIPAVVRWRFHPNPGETNWIPCPTSGCCEVEG